MLTRTKLSRYYIMVRHTFMLHEPHTYACIGKMTGTDYRYASLKAASRGHTVIWIRKTNTKEMREFIGSVIHLDKPKEVKRGDRIIKYTRRPAVKFNRKWTWDDAKIDEDNAITRDSIPVVQQPTAAGNTAKDPPATSSRGKPASIAPAPVTATA